MNKYIMIQLVALSIVLSICPQKTAFADDFILPDPMGTDFEVDHDLERARSNLIKHLDQLQREYVDAQRSYENYLRLADEAKKRMDVLDSTIRREDQALRRVEGTLRARPKDL